MARGKTVSLKGAAARAFVESMKGTEPKSDADAFERLATRIHMEVSVGNMNGAVAVLGRLVQAGAVATAKEIS